MYCYRNDDWVVWVVAQWSQPDLPLWPCFLLFFLFLPPKIFFPSPLSISPIFSCLCLRYDYGEVLFFPGEYLWPRIALLLLRQTTLTKIR